MTAVGNLARCTGLFVVKVRHRCGGVAPVPCGFLTSRCGEQSSSFAVPHGIRNHGNHLKQTGGRVRIDRALTPKNPRRRYRAQPYRDRESAPSGHIVCCQAKQLGCARDSRSRNSRRGGIGLIEIVGHPSRNRRGNASAGAVKRRFILLKPEMCSLHADGVNPNVMPSADDVDVIITWNA
jgi:hypothetical protein